LTLILDLFTGIGAPLGITGIKSSVLEEQMVKFQSWFHKYNSWSYTKHRLWRECRRAYYYNYIGAALETSTEIDIAKIKHLKKLDGRFVVQGKIIHEIIEKFIEDNQSRKKFDEGDAREEYIKQIEAYRKIAKTGIIEYFNGAEVSEAFFDRARENGLDQLSLFFGVIWPQIENYQYLQHEEFDNFFVDGVKAIVKIDYVCKNDNGEVLIYDWKTGADNEEYESDIQISAYALWVQHKYGLPSTKIGCNLVYLTSGAIKTYQFTDQQINDLKTLMSSDFRDMNSNYELANYPPSPNIKACPGCNFATICPSALLNK
jgi:CRISPR/Cas system-associated exonuclease Cas4 (RecB family)